ncbi:MAG: hypothetical protein ACYTFX_09395 [Planctomycetota bacterium]|jgi:hypothetical protein
MAIEAPLSRYKKQNMLIITAILIGVGLWFAYDGYKNQAFIEKHTVDGVPDSTLNFNRKAPPFLVGAGVLLGIYFVISRGKKLIAGENEFVSGNTTIPYDAIEKINKTHFDKKGFFTITYTENGQSKELTLKDRTYDNLPAVLDHIVSKIS